jgi:PPM family protein phosphatase
MGLMLQAAARSDIGRRANNEDSVFASPRLAAVADGVGGAAAGEVASQAVINALVHLDKCRLEGRLEDALACAVGHGNDTIAFIAECRPETAGMSTTLTAVALADEGDYALVNIGDSRTYLLRDGELARLTRDDSLVQELIERGHLTEEQARAHPQRSLVLRALDGTTRDPAAVTTFEAREGDRLLLCSDGLSDVVGDDAIAAVLAGTEDADVVFDDAIAAALAGTANADVVGDDAIAAALAGAPAEACAERLVTLALAAGARDNVSVIVADVVARREPSDVWTWR